MEHKLRHKPLELKKYENQQLIDEFNNMMIRIKRHLFDIPGDTVMPENEELDNLTIKIINVLKKDSKPMIYYKSNEDKSHGNPDCCPGCGNSVYNCKCQ
jgi:ribonuclease HI